MVFHMNTDSLFLATKNPKKMPPPFVDVNGPRRLALLALLGLVEPGLQEYTWQKMGVDL